MLKCFDRQPHKPIQYQQHPTTTLPVSQEGVSMMDAAFIKELERDQADEGLRWLVGLGGLGWVGCALSLLR